LYIVILQFYDISVMLKEKKSIVSQQDIGVI